jgi:hypothetical protein
VHGRAPPWGGCAARAWPAGARHPGIRQARRRICTPTPSPHPTPKPCHRPPPPSPYPIGAQLQLDSWSAGALAYDVLCGRAPFAMSEGISRDDESANILGSDPEFPSGLSYNAVSFMMQVRRREGG